MCNTRSMQSDNIHTLKFSVKCFCVCVLSVAPAIHIEPGGWMLNGGLYVVWRWFTMMMVSCCGCRFARFIVHILQRTVCGPYHPPPPFLLKCGVSHVYIYVWSWFCGFNIFIYIYIVHGYACDPNKYGNIANQKKTNIVEEGNNKYVVVRLMLEQHTFVCCMMET